MMGDIEFSRLLSQKMREFGIPYSSMRTILTGEYLASLARKTQNKSDHWKPLEEEVGDEYQTRLEDVRDVYQGGRKI